MKKIDEIGSILTGLRGDRTKEEVACDLNISVSTLSAYENGERVPRDEVKKRIGDYYGKPVQYIFNSGYNKNMEATKEEIFSEKEFEERITEEMKEDLIRMIESIDDFTPICRLRTLVKDYLEKKDRKNAANTDQSMSCI